VTVTRDRDSLSGTDTVTVTDDSFKYSTCKLNLKKAPRRAPIFNINMILTVRLSDAQRHGEGGVEHLNKLCVTVSLDSVLL
jgi:hypothetical protein